MAPLKGPCPKCSESRRRYPDALPVADNLERIALISEENDIVFEGELRRSGRSSGRGLPSLPGRDASFRHCSRSTCQVAEHCWDPVGHAIVTYGYLFDGLIQPRQREV